MRDLLHLVSLCKFNYTEFNFPLMGIIRLTKISLLTYLSLQQRTDSFIKSFGICANLRYR